MLSVNTSALSFRDFQYAPLRNMADVDVHSPNIEQLIVSAFCISPRRYDKLDFTPSAPRHCICCMSERVYIIASWQSIVTRPRPASDLQRDSSLSIHPQQLHPKVCRDPLQWY